MPDNGNQLPDLSETTTVDGEDDLVPVDLAFPVDVKPGAQVTLTATTTMVSVWSEQTKSQRLIGYPDTARTWVVGRDVIPLQVWVEGLEGSSTVDDIRFVLSATDATADEPPQNPTNTSGEKKTSGIKFSIVLSMLDHGVYRGQDVTDGTQDWLIGWMVDAYVSIKCPPEIRPQNPTYDWTVRGNVLRDYVVAPDASFANVIPLGDQHGGTESEPLNGKKQSAITYFWVSTNSVAPACDIEPVTVTLGNVPGAPFPLKTTFRVFTPTSAPTVTDFGTGSLTTATDKVGLFKNGAIPGITIDCTVQMPNGAEPGQWFYLQKMNRRRTIMDRLPDQSTQGLHSPNYGQWGLDERYVGGGPWLTGGAHPFVDSPHNPLVPSLVSSSINDDFITWVMFQPAGNSRPVPLQMVTWHVNAEAINLDGVWGLTGAEGQSKGVFSRTSEEPTWTLRHSRLDAWEDDPEP